jgi:predicted RNA binding protein YcfA (HicA-like mRNA interferase family)
LKEAEMQIRILEEAGFISKGGTNHEKFVKGDKLVLVKRHREIEEQIAKRILRQAGLR